MQVRYQLRHSPRSDAARVRATPGILANARPAMLIGGRAPDTRGHVVRREPQPPGARLGHDRPGAVVHRLEPVGGLQRPPEEAGQGDPQRRAVRDERRRSPPARAARGPPRRPAGTIRPATSSAALGAGHLHVGVGVPAEPSSSPSCSANSSRVRPVRSPTSYSRSRGSSSAVSPVSFSRNAAVSRARARSLLTSSAGSQAATTGGHRLGLVDDRCRPGRCRRAPGLAPRRSRRSGRAGRRTTAAVRPARCAQRPRPEVTSAGSGITGQSRQSRSRA